jgi:16S rRNA (adenine1518-N6/adenine1519-N6)-dimethyltransferase
MIQKEVADSLLAKPRTKEYGHLTVVARYHNTIKRMLEVRRENFYPIPNVDSTVICLESKQPSADLNDYKLFRQILKTAFQQRRKMLRNSLKNLLMAKHLDVVESINLNSRPEELSVENYINLSNEIAINDTY